MRTFHVRYTSCPAPQSTQTLNASLFSETLANGHPPHYIQMMTPLLLSLIQSAITRPTFAAPSNPNNNNTQEDGDDDASDGVDKEEPQMQFVSGLRGCQAIADTFALQLLQRCSRKGEDGGASEFRPILVNLVEDLLLVLMVPEYPAAQMVLLSCANVLSRDVINASQDSGDKVVESTYINTAFDTLGRICSAYAKILAAQRQREFPTTAIQVSGDRKHVRCYCKRNEWTDTLMVSPFVVVL
jgi:cohesin loading factor subunit SCC2